MNNSSTPTRLRFLGSIEDFTYADDRWRPTWEPQKGYRLSAEHRHQLCVHLAAHAVINHLGGAFIYKLAVAPASVRSWTVSERKTGSLGKLWGVCSTSDFYTCRLQRDEDHQIFVADRKSWERDTLREYRPAQARGDTTDLDHPAVSYDDFLACCRQTVRAQACGYLAGHIADGLTAGLNAEEALRLYDRRDTQHVGEGSDIVIAEGLAGLLPHGEYENAVRVTEEVLRRPEIWESVNRLGRLLEQFGLLEGDECEGDMYDCLPEPLRDWPPAPESGITNSDS